MCFNLILGRLSYNSICKEYNKGVFFILFVIIELIDLIVGVIKIIKNRVFNFDLIVGGVIKNKVLEEIKLNF